MKNWKYFLFYSSLCFTIKILSTLKPHSLTQPVYHRQKIPEHRRKAGNWWFSSQHFQPFNLPQEKFLLFFFISRPFSIVFLLLSNLILRSSIKHWFKVFLRLLIVCHLLRLLCWFFRFNFCSIERTDSSGFTCKH